MLYSTFMIGIIPLVILGGWALLQQEQKFLKIAAELNQADAGIPAGISKNEKLVFDIPLSQIRLVEALQNYVKIYYLDPEGVGQSKTVRTTLKQILEQTKDSPILQSHRSFLVNREAILSSTGNAQGLLLQLSGCDKRVPVSRSYVATFRQKQSLSGL